MQKLLEDQRKSRYYKEAVNLNLEDQKYLFVLIRLKKKTNIVKIRTKFHDLHSKIRHWKIPKTPWHERIFDLCDIKRVEGENNFLIECHAYTHIRVQFKNIFYNTNIPNILSNHNLIILLLNPFYQRNTILKKTMTPFLFNVR